VTQGKNDCPVFSPPEVDFGFAATKGWDPVTGAGTPNFEAIRAKLGV
jgi:hypothetical protein